MAEHATATRERPAAAKAPASPTRRPSHVGPTPAPFRASSRGGVPLHGDVAGPIARSLGIDVSGIRVHTDGNAAAASRRHGALAFAHGSDIFLGAGQRPNDLPLMAHEVAHVVQQRQAPRVQLWTPYGSDRFEREAGRAAAAAMGGRPFSIVERTLPTVQRDVVDDVLAWATDHAYAIPGFRLLTIVLGFNPLTGKAVERLPVNILSGLIEVLPGGALVTTVLNKYGILAKVAAWVEQQFHALGDIGGSLLKAIGGFKASLGAADLLSPGAAIDRALNLVHGPINRIHDFGFGLLTEIVNFVKDAVLRPLGDIARQQSGWDLLCAVLGKDPITGDKVERTAENLIGGFMKLIGHEEVWTNIKAANAGPRAFAWFQGALAGLMGFVQQIPSMFISALKALELADLIDLPSTFLRFAKVFGSFALRFISWATDQIIELLKIVVQAVAPKVMPYLEKAAGAFKDIINNPMKFVGNLISAAKLGFQNFAANFVEHLKAGLLDWLTGSLPGIYIPKAFTLPEIFKLVLSVLGLTWENIRGKLVKVIGDTAVKALETGFEIVVKLVREGPAAAWEEIKSQLSNLRDSVLGGIVSFVTETIVQKAIPQLISLFIPGAGFITAIVKVYDTIMVFVSKISKIIQVVTNFIDSISAIASGAIGGAAKKVESTLENLLSLAINFLAGFIGLGNVSDKIKGVLEKIRATVDKAIDWLINWIVTMAKKVKALFTGTKGDEKPKGRDAQLDAAVAAVEKLSDEPDATLDSVRSKLPAIQAQYGLTSLALSTTHEEAGTPVAELTATINPNHKKKIKFAPDEVGDKIDFERPRWMAATKLGLILWFVQDFGPAKIRQATGSFKARRKYARRHIVSFNDVADHYRAVLQPTLKIKDAVALLAQFQGGKYKPAKETRAAVVEKVRQILREAFNDVENLRAGLQAENNAIKTAFDDAMLMRKVGLAPVPAEELQERFDLAKALHIGAFRARWELPHATLKLLVTGVDKPSQITEE